MRLRQPAFMEPQSPINKDLESFLAFSKQIAIIFCAYREARRSSHFCSGGGLKENWTPGCFPNRIGARSKGLRPGACTVLSAKVHRDSLLIRFQIIENTMVPNSLPMHHRPAAHKVKCFRTLVWNWPVVFGRQQVLEICQSFLNTLPI